MIFARRIFQVAAWYGFLILVPHYFLEAKIGQDTPPPITHPEFYYGFVGVALAFQFVFLFIARDPVRYRAMMLPSILEKFSFFAAVVVLFLQGRAPALLLAPATIDMLFGALFFVAYAKTSTSPA